MPITSKPYRCATCGNRFEVPTNNDGEIYNSCKACRSYGGDSIAVCESEAAKIARDARPEITVRVYPYRFDIGDAAQNQAYLAMIAELRSNSYKVFRHLVSSNVKHNSIETIQAIAKTGLWIHIFTDAKMGNQWPMVDGGRLHQWAECEFPNRDIRSGYYVAIDDMKKM